MILGGMEELGPDEEKLHQDAGGQIHLGQEDQVVLVGQKASWMAASILENGARPDQVIVLECPEDCRSLVEDFDGNIFLKGSRKYKLEEIIPQWAVEQSRTNGVCTMLSYLQFMRRGLVLSGYFSLYRCVRLELGLPL